MIRYLDQGQIDRKKWDACVKSSRAAFIYAYSWYLDLVSPGWKGLVEDDYQAVMPLPVKEKYRIKYVYQPVFTQQLGIFTRFPVNQEKISDFFQAIPDELQFIDTHLNLSNNVDGLGFFTESKVNCELRLNKRYPEIEKLYAANTRRNIQKSILKNEIVTQVRINDLIRLKRENAAVARSREHYEWMNCFIDKLLQRRKGFIIGARVDGKLAAAAFFAATGKRIYYLIPVSGKNGKEARSMFAIIDHVIGKYAGTGLTLDFEGSNVPGIARFFAGFGAQKVPYHHVKINRLPVWLRILKR